MEVFWFSWYWVCMETARHLTRKKLFVVSVRSYFGNITNFTTHLEHHHPAEYSSFLKDTVTMASTIIDMQNSILSSTTTLLTLDVGEPYIAFDCVYVVILHHACVLEKRFEFRSSDIEKLPTTPTHQWYAEIP